MQRLSIGEALRTANRILGAHFGVFAILAAVQTFGYLFALPWDGGGAMPSGITWFWLLVAALGLSLPASIAAIAAADQAVRGAPVQLAAAMRPIGPRYLPFLGLLILLGIAVGIGTMLLVIPGIYLTVMLFVALPACVIEQAGPIDSLRRSAALTRGHRWRIFALGAVFLIVAMVVSILIQLLFLGAPVVFVILSFVWSALTSIYGLLLTVTVYRFCTTTTASSASTLSA